MKHNFPRHQKKERRGTNSDKTNTTYETTDAQTNNSNRGTALKQSVGKLLGGQLSLLPLTKKQQKNIL